MPIFKRLKDALDTVFFEKDDKYLKDVIFEDNKAYYEKLKRLHAQKEELQRLKKLCSLKRPFVIEFSGTPRTGKTTTINNLNDFFKKGGFKTAIIEEFTTSKYYKEIFKQKYNDADLSELHIAIIEEVTKQLKDAINSDREIILIDRSINDRQIWNYRRYLQGNISEELYQRLKEKYSAISNDLIDFLVITYADSLTSLKRDYNCSLALEKRNFLNVSSIEEYNKCLKDLLELFEVSVENFVFLDTTSVDINDISVEIASWIMPIMRKRYIKSFEANYNLKRK